MSTLSYLIKNRTKPPLFSYAWLRAWGKRVLTLKEVLNRTKNRNRLVNKGAKIDENAVIGYAKIEGKVNKLSVGKNTFIGRVEIALHDEVTIGENICINDGVILLTASHDLDDPAWNHKKGKVVIEDYAWIATNAIILPGVRIGRGAVVGAGAVVRKSVPDYGIVIGNPAVLIDKKRTQTLDYNPCEFLAGSLAWLKG
ncbi:MAG: acyltransferase [Spirosomataceae bacterium]